MMPEEKEHYADKKFYDDLGRYFVVFQALESYLDKMIMLAIGHDRYTIGLAVLSKLSNKHKIDILKASVLGTGVKAQSLKFNPSWLDEFKKFIRDCVVEAEYRNSLAHGNFIFDFVKIGAPILNNRLSIRKDGVSIKNIPITEEEMTIALKRIAEVCLAANFIHVQLVSWSEEFSKSISLKDDGNDEPVNADF